MWKQLIFPNLDDKNFVVHHPDGSILSSWLGWCLAVTQKQFGVAPFAPTAREAWERNKDKHGDYDLPNGMFVPIFWTGDRNNWGHIAIALREGNNVKIWTSPYRHKAYLDYFEGELKFTIDQVSKAYGMKWFVGWSTMLNNTRIIEWVEPPKPKPAKSNEEICAEIWAGKWGNGKDRWNRLKEAGYDPAIIQGMIDNGVGKPKPPEKEEKPAPEPSKETEIVPNTPNEPNNEQKPEDDKDTNHEPQTPTPAPQDEPKIPGDKEKPFEHAPAAPDNSNELTKPKEQPMNPEAENKNSKNAGKSQAGGGIFQTIINIIKMIIKILTTKKEK